MELNKEQNILVNEHNRNILLLVSAGTVKTETLSKRVAEIINEEKADLINTYNSLLNSNNSLDFDDLILRTKKLLMEIRLNYL